MEFPFNVFETAKANDFKFGMQGFPLINLQLPKVTTSKLAIWWGLPRPIIKSYPEEKEGVTMG